jgi:hypothetical protein
MAFAHTTIGIPSRSSPAALYGGDAATVLSIDAAGHVEVFPLGARSALDLLVRIGDGATMLRVDPIVERVMNKLREVKEAAA